MDEPQMIGTYTLSSGDELRAKLLPTLSPADLPTLDVLTRSPLYAFSNGETGTWWAVETPEQAETLTRLGATQRERIFTRQEIEDWSVSAGADSAQLRSLSLFDLLKRGLAAEQPKPEQGEYLAPPPLTPDSPGLEQIEDGHGTWLRLVAAWAAEDPRVARDLGPDFFLEDAWLVGGPNVPTSIVVSTQDQADTLSSINTKLISRGERPFPVWSPDSLEAYVGPHLVLFDGASRARLVTALQRAIVNTTHQAEQTACQRMLALNLGAPLFTKVTLTLIMAHEVAGKSLLKCTADELEEVHKAVSKLLLAAGSATPFRRADLPKPRTTSESGDGGYL